VPRPMKGIEVPDLVKASLILALYQYLSNS